MIKNFKKFKKSQNLKTLYINNKTNYHSFIMQNNHIFIINKLQSPKNLIAKD